MTPAPLSLRAFGHRLLVALLICCVITAALGVAVLRAEDAKVADIPAADIPASLLQAGGNYLIIGSDTRSFVNNPTDAAHFGSAASQSGQRSDTIMVAHIDPGKHTGVLVSFPRDLWVAIPGHGTSKINAAFAFGGPKLTIQTIEQDFNIPISHYLEVDFEGFRDIVNAIGTVPIYFPTPARDHNSGLLITTPGCHDLDGNDALAYVRSRYYEYETDGVWHQDPTSDLGRIQRQQYFIRSLSSAAIHSVLAHPLSISRVVDKSVKAFVRDKTLTASDLRALILAFRDTNPADFPMYTLPATNSYIDRQDVLLLNTALAAPTLARLRGSAPAPKSEGPVPKIPPSSVRVTVANGSGVTGAGRIALDQLSGDGFTVGAPASNADRSDYSVTEVRYNPGAKTKGDLVLHYLGGAGKLVALGSPVSGVDVVVVLGQDFKQVTAPGGTATTTPTSAAAPGSTAHTPTANTSKANSSTAHGVTTTTGPPANPGGAMPVAGC